MERRFLCQTWQRWLRPQRVCFRVISEFFHPQPIRVFGDETQQQFADGQVSDQCDAYLTRRRMRLTALAGTR